ncbi:MAG: hypothetical protein N3D73_01915 [Candidatus Diapherotrites archaeon]|nr:hypothetical protein [Candidatus Diapherotrites archaeon]
MKRRIREGHPLEDTEEMKLWRKQFEKMTLKEHDEKLRQLGLEEEDIEEFNREFSDLDKKRKDK